jgi:hypothetical protein
MGTAGLNTLIQPFFLTKSSYSAKLICTSVSDSIYLSSVPLTVLVRKDEACGESEPAASPLCIAEQTLFEDAPDRYSYCRPDDRPGNEIRKPVDRH